MTRVASNIACLCAGFALAIGTVAFAQSYDPDIGTGNLGVGVGYMVQPDGTTARVGGKTGRINDAGHQAIMSYAQELPPGSMLYKHNNKLHVLKNQMVNGRMLPEYETEWTK